MASLPTHLRQILQARLSWALLALLLGVHLGVEMLGGVQAWSGWYETLGLSRARFFSGKFWQLATYGLLHGDWWHVGLNGLLVLMIGARIEHIAGRAAVLRVTVAGVLSGGLFHLLLGHGLLVGFSGGCMALLLMLSTLSPQSKMLPLPLSAKSLGRGILCAALILSLINPALNFPGFSRVGRAIESYGLGAWFQIGHACHFGGALAGWLYGRWILRPRITIESLRRERARRETE